MHRTPADPNVALFVTLAGAAFVLYQAVKWWWWNWKHPPRD
jgi:hypothetical protein